jgi:hypothetical protein
LFYYKHSSTKIVSNQRSPNEAPSTAPRNIYCTRCLELRRLAATVAHAASRQGAPVLSQTCRAFLLRLSFYIDHFEKPGVRLRPNVLVLSERFELYLVGVSGYQMQKLMIAQL